MTVLDPEAAAVICTWAVRCHLAPLEINTPKNPTGTCVRHTHRHVTSADDASAADGGGERKRTTH